jgi:DNA-binding transcriptional MocR family regulator
MERGSAKHGPLKDDFLDEEAYPLTHGHPANDARGPSLDELPEGEEGTVGLPPSFDTAPPHGLPEGLLQFRTELAQYLRPHDFPATRERLIASANDLGATPEVIQLLCRLPGDRELATFSDVWRTLGFPTED